MKNQKEMMEALLAGERLVGIEERSVNEYWLDKQDGRIYYRNTKKGTFTYRCNGIPTFDKLRVKPKTININGIEVPEPAKDLKIGDRYWVPNLGVERERAIEYIFDHSYRSDTHRDMGFAHRTKEAAELHAQALVSFTRPEVRP